MCMMTLSNGNISRVTGPFCGESPVTGEFPSQRPFAQSFDVFFDMRLNNRLRKQSMRRWIEAPLRSLWRHCNAPSQWETALHYNDVCHWLGASLEWFDLAIDRTISTEDSIPVGMCKICICRAHGELDFTKSEFSSFWPVRGGLCFYQRW